MRYSRYTLVDLIFVIAGFGCSYRAIATGRVAMRRIFVRRDIYPVYFWAGTLLWAGLGSYGLLSLTGLFSRFLLW